jgi:hypothetical protein
MKKLLNNIWNYITTMGWLGLPGSFMRLDLQLHGLAGLWMVVPFYMIPHYELEVSKTIAFIIAVLGSTLVASLKEYSDSKKINNKFDWLDLVTTVGFTIAGALLMVTFR